MNETLPLQIIATIACLGGIILSFTDWDFVNPIIISICGIVVLIATFIYELNEEP